MHTRIKTVFLIKILHLFLSSVNRFHIFFCYLLTYVLILKEENDNKQMRSMRRQQ